MTITVEWKMTRKSGLEMRLRNVARIMGEFNFKVSMKHNVT